jgi:hypothetical protein
MSISIDVILSLISIIIIFLISNYLSFGYGMRVGKAMQKDIPPVPLAEPIKQTAKAISKLGKKTVKLVRDVNELKAVKRSKKEPEEHSMFD